MNNHLAFQLLYIQNIEDAPVFKEADNILPDASVNVSYEYSLLWEDADNEIPSFSIVSEDVRPLPDGLNLSDGRIIGVPEQEENTSLPFVWKMMNLYLLIKTYPAGYFIQR